MYVYLIYEQIFWEMKDVVERYRKGENLDFSEMNSVMERLIHGAESHKEMITDKRKIGDKEFYDMLREFAYITWTEIDSLRVLETVPIKVKKNRDLICNEHNFVDESGKYFKYALKYIKKFVVSNGILEDLFDDNLDNINIQVENATVPGYEGSKNEWDLVSQEYAKEFEERGFARRLKQLNDTKFRK